MYEYGQTCRSRFEGYRDFHREGGHGEIRCLEDPELSEEVFLQYVADFRNELTFEWPGNNLLSPRRVVQFCLKSGSGTLKSSSLDLEFLLTMN